MKQAKFSGFDQNDLERYRNASSILANLGSSLVFNNSGVDHAVIVFSTIFEYSKNIVRIFANNMKGEISDNKEYIRALKSFLQKGGSLKIVIRDDQFLVNRDRKIKKVLNEFSITNDIEIRLVSDAFLASIKKISKQGELFYFVTGDNKMFRMESDNHNHLATVSFNRPSECKKMIEAFDSEFDSCKKINM